MIPFRLKSDKPTEEASLKQRSSNTEYIDKIIQNLDDDVAGPDVASIKKFLEPVFPTKRPIVFTCPHWGNYIQSFLAIGKAFPPESKFIAFRGPEWKDEDALWNAVNEKSSKRISIFRVHDKAGLRDVVRSLRSGVSAFILFDLHQGFGQTAPIEIFDQTIFITFKWIEMAYLTNAIVIFIKPVSIERDWIEIFDVLDSNGFSTKEQFKDRSLQTCGQLLRTLLSENPDFWFMWQDFEKYQQISP